MDVMLINTSGGIVGQRTPHCQNICASHAGDLGRNWKTTTDKNTVKTQLHQFR